MLIERKVYYAVCDGYNGCNKSFGSDDYDNKESLITDMEDCGWMVVGEECYCAVCRVKQEKKLMAKSNKEGIKKEIKHIQGLSKVLDTLAKEVAEKGFFDEEDLELLKKVGSDILFKGAALDYISLM